MDISYGVKNWSGSFESSSIALIGSYRRGVHPPEPERQRLLVQSAHCIENLNVTNMACSGTNPGAGVSADPTLSPSLAWQIPVVTLWSRASNEFHAGFQEVAGKNLVNPDYRETASLPTVRADRVETLRTYPAVHF